jgi:hypothetical protein
MFSMDSPHDYFANPFIRSRYESIWLFFALLQEVEGYFGRTLSGAEGFFVKSPTLKHLYFMESFLE